MGAYLRFAGEKAVLAERPASFTMAVMATPVFFRNRRDPFAVVGRREQVLNKRPDAVLVVVSLLPRMSDRKLILCVCRVLSYFIFSFFQSSTFGWSLVLSPFMCPSFLALKPFYQRISGTSKLCSDDGS